MIVLAVILSRTEGPLKIGLGGIETEIRGKAVAGGEQLKASLDAEGLDLPTIASEGKSLSDSSAADEIRTLLSSLLQDVARLDTGNADRVTAVPASVLLDAAHGLAASQEWTDAAHYFDRYIELEPNDWDALFSRAVSHANAGGGSGADVRALRAYNDAIALRPQDTDPNLLARLFSYRGAMLKRLERLVEAESDLNLARRIATAPYELQDIAYNLACVYAMDGRREEAIREVQKLNGTSYIGHIRGHLDDYFARLADDPGFLALLGDVPGDVAQAGPPVADTGKRA